MLQAREELLRQGQQLSTLVHGVDHQAFAESRRYKHEKFDLIPPWVSFQPRDPRQHVSPVCRGLCLVRVEQSVGTSVVRALEDENLETKLRYL